MLLYIEADKKEKEALLTKKKLKIEILKDLREDPKGYEGISYQKRSLTKFNHENFFHWVNLMFPDKINVLREDKIDYNRFEQAYASGEIYYTEIPEDCYSIEDQDVVLITKEK
jgi:hypothetical protein